MDTVGGANVSNKNDAIISLLNCILLVRKILAFVSLSLGRVILWNWVYLPTIVRHRNSWWRALLNAINISLKLNESPSERIFWLIDKIARISYPVNIIEWSNVRKMLSIKYHLKSCTSILWSNNFRCRHSQILINNFDNLIEFIHWRVSNPIRHLFPECFSSSKLG